MPTLFDPIQVGDLSLPNRIFMAPMTRSRASDDGVPTEPVPLYYSQRAGAGLIVSEATNVSAMAKGYDRTPGMFTDAQVAGWRKVTDAVHAAGGRIFSQLFHTGRVAVPDLLPEGAEPVAPSAIAINGKNYTDAGPKPFVVPRPLGTEEIPAIAAEFAAAAKRALAAGFNGVELHAASGYLVHQFLDAAANQRTDLYGGPVENRVRFLLQALDDMIAVAGAGRVGVKVSPQIKFNDIVEPDAEAVYDYLARELSRRNIAYLHVARMGEFDWHAFLRPRFSGIYAAGGGIDQAKGEAMLAAGDADVIVYGKPFVANPDLLHRFRNGAELAKSDSATYYSRGTKGYTDYMPFGG
ncbi:MAG TPA: alkene reductase [Beijerinckiaceae bacterium]|nr:alkene reductase [Beijerinckiaceae bacterium]